MRCRLLALALLFLAGSRVQATEVAWAHIGGSPGIGTAVPRAFGPKGVYSPASQPGALMAHGMATDGNGTVYLFFGSPTGAAPQDTVWKYDPQAGNGHWMWAAGSEEGGGVNWGTFGHFSAAATPGARLYAPVVFDGTLFWVFGGSLSGVSVADLWAFDPATGQWAWMGGCDVVEEAGVVGVYEEQGAGSNSTRPGSRITHLAVADGSGDLWIGFGVCTAALASGSCNDLWQYQRSTGFWIWQCGSTNVNQHAMRSYGTLGLEAAGNQPGARALPAYAIDRQDNIYLFGGETYGQTAATGFTNDLWIFSIARRRWTWLAGTSVLDGPALPTFGVKGAPAPGNTPRGRFAALMVAEADGTLW